MHSDATVGILHNLLLTFCITQTLCVVGLYGGSRRRRPFFAPWRARERDARSSHVAKMTELAATEVAEWPVQG